MAPDILTRAPSELLNRTVGRWSEILLHFGLDASFLRPGRNGPCPFCGGTDRYHFANSHDCGSYYCRQCGGGNGLTFLRKLTSWDAAKAMGEIDAYLMSHVAPAPKPKPPGKSSGQRLADIKALLAACTEPSIAARYLAERGVRQGSTVLLGHAACPFFDKKLPELSGRCFPAMVAPIVGPLGGIVTAARQYCDECVEIPSEARKKFMPIPWEHALKGAACRLHAPTDGKLLVAEGIITALSAAELFKLPCWAAMSSWGIEHFVPPPDVSELFVAADNDLSWAGQAAATALAMRLSRDRPEITLHVEWPLGDDTDWNDVLRQVRR